MGWAREESAGTNLYQNTLATSVLEYLVVLFLGSWVIVEFFYNEYQQQYFGSFNPVFLTLVLIVASGFGFARLVRTVGHAVGPPKKAQPEDDY